MSTEPSAFFCNPGVVEALQYARALSLAAKAVYVEMDPERTRRL